MKTTDPLPATPGANTVSNKSKCQQVALCLKSAYEKAVSKMKDISGQSIKVIFLDKLSIQYYSIFITVLYGKLCGL